MRKGSFWIDFITKISIAIIRKTEIPCDKDHQKFTSRSSNNSRKVYTYFGSLRFCASCLSVCLPREGPGNEASKSGLVYRSRASDCFHFLVNPRGAGFFSDAAYASVPIHDFLSLLDCPRSAVILLDLLRSFSFGSFNVRKIFLLCHIKSAGISHIETKSYIKGYLPRMYLITRIFDNR